tara:strand:+ start:281 stop:511 length:231 start_codon:yes stop_codon:yes gene_type:complete
VVKRVVVSLRQTAAALSREKKKKKKKKKKEHPRLFLSLFLSLTRGRQRMGRALSFVRIDRCGAHALLSLFLSTLLH